MHKKIQTRQKLGCCVTRSHICTDCDSFYSLYWLSGWHYHFLERRLTDNTCSSVVRTRNSSMFETRSQITFLYSVKQITTEITRTTSISFCKQYAIVLFLLHFVWLSRYLQCSAVMSVIYQGVSNIEKVFQTSRCFLYSYR